MQKTVDLRSKKTKKRVSDVDIDDVSLYEAVEIIGSLSSTRGGVVVTCNVDHALTLRIDSRLRRAYNNADLVTADGSPIVLLSRLVGQTLHSRVTGADLVPAVCDLAAKRGLKLALFGGEEGVGEAAARELQRRHPTLQPPIVVTPPMNHVIGGKIDHTLVDELAHNRPNIVVVGLGMPKQEIWADYHRKTLSPAVIICAGAAIDFLAKRQRRAPRLVQKIGLEWMWRLSTDFRRLWRRYLVRDLAFVPYAIGEILLHRSTRESTHQDD
ncbi:WecB/TagA/CpsF family glycosyltransferase [Frankia torreyi]